MMSSASRPPKLTARLLVCPEGFAGNRREPHAAHRIRRLPVIAADGRLVGILSLNDLARKAAHVHTGTSKARVRAQDISDTLAAKGARHDHDRGPVATRCALRRSASNSVARSERAPA
jgi:CBS-domain-containing membrane protein